MMEKRLPLLLRVQKHRNLNQNKNKRIKKKFVEKVMEYLLSDSYMYAPLISSRPSDALTSNTIKSSSPSGPASDKSEGVINSVLSARETINKRTEETSCRRQAPSLLQMKEKEKEKGLHSEIHVVDQTPTQTQTRRVGRAEMVKKMVHYNTNSSCIPSGTGLGHGNKCSTAASTISSKPASLVTPTK